MNKMGKLLYLVVAFLAVTYAENRVEKQPIVDDSPIETASDKPESIPLYKESLLDDFLDNVNAGPLRATEDNEVIIVSRDNVQQLVKTLMLAYSHSKDPAMMQLLRGADMSVLKNTFRHAGSGDFDDSFLRAAQKLIEELDLENEEEQVLGEFAEKYLKKHKFKVMMPESFLLNEVDMVDFLKMKFKSGRRQGKSMPEPEQIEPLDLNAVLNYDGRQFSTSIIPGMDLTWIALLGGMIAIPYYFWSDTEEPQPVAMARKDNFPGMIPVPEFMPPQYSPGMSLNDLSVNRRGAKKERRNRRKHMKINDERYHVQEFKQIPLNSIPENAQITPALLRLPDGGSLPPMGTPIKMLRNEKLPLPGPGRMGPQIMNRNFNTAPHMEMDMLLPPPLLSGEPEEDQNLMIAPKPDGIDRMSDDSVAGESSLVPEITEKAAAFASQFDVSKPRPNPVLKPKKYKKKQQQKITVEKKREKDNASMNKKIKQNHMRVQNQRHPTNFRVPSTPGMRWQPFPNGEQGPPMMPMLPPPQLMRMNERPFDMPPHGPHGQFPHGMLPPQHPSFMGHGPMLRFDGPPPHGFNGPTPSGFNGPLPPGFNGPPPGFNGPPPFGFNSPPPFGFNGPPPFGFNGPHLQNFNGPRLPEFNGPVHPDFQGNPESPQVLFVPSVNMDKYGSGEKRETFGTFRPEREGYTHFKVKSDPKSDEKKRKFSTEKKDIISPKKDIISPKKDIFSPKKDISAHKKRPTVTYSRPDMVIRLDANMQSTNQFNNQKPNIPRVNNPSRNSNKNYITSSIGSEQNQVVHIQHTRPQGAQVNLLNNQEDKGFLPVYGPPTVPQLLSPTTLRPELPKPSAFLDKLLSEQQENKSHHSSVYSKKKKTDSFKEKLAKEKLRNSQTKFVPTTPRSSVSATSRTGVPEFSSHVRVVTSKSVVTSRPIPLGKHHPSYYSHKKEKKNKKHIVMGEAVFDVNGTNAIINEIDVSKEKAVQDNYDRSYKNVQPEKIRSTNEYERNQNDDLATTESSINDISSGEDTNNVDHGNVNRMLDETPAKVAAKRLKPKGKSMPMYALDPFYGPRLSRADAIFAQMHLSSEGCREQVVCNMYKNPDVYTPLSDFLSRQLTVTLDELKKPQVADERILRFFRYLQAARTGQDGGDCLQKYPTCAQDTTKLSHKPIIDAFYKVSDLMNHDKQ